MRCSASCGCRTAAQPELMWLVASTTAFVRHNLPQAAWASGIALYPIVFAAGPIVGPTCTGWISDGPGGLVRGLAVSAVLLAVGAVVAALQKPITMR